MVFIEKNQKKDYINNTRLPCVEEDPEGVLLMQGALCLFK